MLRQNAFVFAVDQNYLPYALHLITQIERLETLRSFDFCLISDSKITLPEEFSYLDIKVLDEVSDPEYLAIPITTRHPRSAFLRLWAPKLLSDYKRLIYLDADMFLEGRGISNLFDLDLEGHVLAAVRDIPQWTRPEYHGVEFKRAGLPALPYFNSGLLLIDTAAFNSAQIAARGLGLVQDHPDWVTQNDQSMLNLVLAGKWLELSPIWNWQWGRKYPHFTDWLSPRLFHFIGPEKPWRDPQARFPRRFFLSYEAFLAKHFPDLRALMVEPGASPMLRLKWAIPHSARFWTRRGATKRLLARYPDIDRKG